MQESSEMNCPPGVLVKGEIQPQYERVLTYDALAFLADLHRRFNYARLQLLEKRLKRQLAINAGQPMEYPKPNHGDDWKVAPVPADLQRRHVEITGPTDRKMVINALNSGADIFMADFEDSLSPTWKNIIEGQANLMDAERGTITFQNADGSLRKLKEKIACLIVRTRGWHLDEGHILCDGQPMAGALVDFGLYFFHNIHVRMQRGSATYYYLPKMETFLECRLWNQVFQAAEEYLQIPEGTIRATVMIETLPAALDIEEMIYELREYCCGANAGRWDYIFSIIKRLQSKPEAVLPDRKQVAMTVPFMRSYTDRIVKICHKHAAHAMGGMSAFIPSRHDEEINKKAFSQVKGDKEREVADGFDGTWVAHPDLVKVAREVFLKGMQNANHQKHRLREDVNVTVNDLTTIKVDGGKITEAGVRLNVSVALKYINEWLQGRGAVAVNNLMEDAATAEISRAQLWQWLRHSVILDDGQTFTPDMYRTIREEEFGSQGGAGKGRLQQASEILDHLVLSRNMEEFLTLPSYKVLDNSQAKL
ncbi:malate synthase-like [Xenia sp. Carnegie-2017]|uniref:malate synthase-like n=1 Tax=Xenia sp. Carnegie-2017 TaxID=2897299 RepID=UPI001F0404D7|nr:malate synthase-like [Xenia sp. Carnegie-2017]